MDDSGADQSIVNLNMFSTFNHNSVYFDIGSATSEIKLTVSLELVNNAYT